MQGPTFTDVLQARRNVERHLPRTPLAHYPALDQLVGVAAIVVVPEGANALKVAAMRNYGAEVVFHGQDFDEARVYCETLALEKNMRYVHSGNEPLLIAGVGTIALEILEDAPDVGIIIVPVGGGSGAAAACLVAKTINTRIRVIG